MPPVPVVPDSLAALLSLLRPCFTAPTWEMKPTSSQQKMS